jgi:iron complex transport system ATP-binding protein
MISVRNLSVSFGKSQILSDISLDIPKGQVISLCGPNGAGKSTLLSAVVGELRAFRGEICYGTQSLTRLSATALSTQRSVLEQSPSLSAEFTVSELVRLSIPIEISPHETNQIMSSVLDVLSLQGFENRLVSNLSGGQRHRAHLARVLAHMKANKLRYGDGYLFLDEPTASLDIRHQIEVMKIAKSAAEDGAGVLVVMHDLNLAAAFSDKVALLEAGTLVKHGSISQVMRADVLSDVYATPISVIRPIGGPLLIHPSLSEAL